jgi:Domain of unknown function (DUF4136)
MTHASPGFLRAFRLALTAIVCVGAVCGQKVKTKVYTDSKECFKTYHLETGRVLTAQGLIEDPTVNSIMGEAVATQMNGLKIGSASTAADLVVRFMGGVGAGLQVDDFAVGTYAVWNLGGGLEMSSRTYKKSELVIVVVDGKSNRALWAAQCIDNFGDPNKIKERIENAVAKAFAKFPKNLACS